MDAHGRSGPPFSEKAFDEFHLYSIAPATTLQRPRTKQVEFCHAEKDVSRRPSTSMRRARLTSFTGLNTTRYGQSDNKKTIVQREFKNAETQPARHRLPAQAPLSNRRDDDAQLAVRRREHH